MEVGILFFATILEEQNHGTILLDAELGIRPGHH